MTNLQLIQRPRLVNLLPGMILAPVLAMLATGCGSTPSREGSRPDGSAMDSLSGDAGASGGAGGGRAQPLDGGATCTVEGTIYENGATGIPAPDGCNTCNCEQGQLACTLLGCPIPGRVCGGLLGSPCAKGSYCKYATSAPCGAADATGACAPIPEVCTAQYAPVCACDGKTYGNACGAAAVGLSISHTGECAPAPAPGSCVVDGVSYPDGAGNIPASDGCNICSCASGALRCTLRACAVPKACGARAGNTCSASEYCAYTEGLYCGAADAEAVCKPRPNLCPTSSVPVCGCNGLTYANACSASLAGSGVLHAGPCTNPKVCGGDAGLTCDSTEYCAYVEGQHCGAADASSTCTKRPDGCTSDVNPVCGCDGKTYSNSCSAALAGVGYSARGVCQN